MTDRPRNLVSTSAHALVAVGGTNGYRRALRRKIDGATTTDLCFTAGSGFLLCRLDDNHFAKVIQGPIQSVDLTLRTPSERVLDKPIVDDAQNVYQQPSGPLSNGEGHVDVPALSRANVLLHVDVDDEVALSALGLGEVLESVSLPGSPSPEEDAVVLRREGLDEGPGAYVRGDYVFVAYALSPLFDLLECTQQIHGSHMASSSAVISSRRRGASSPLIGDAGRIFAVDQESRKPMAMRARVLPACCSWRP